MNAYLGNQLIASYEAYQTTPEWTYYNNDHLGSPRLITGSGGNTIATPRYAPYGESLSVAGVNPQQFAGLERDASSGYDYDHARYNGSTLGRFLTPDRIQGRLSNPQTWNRYSYALGNAIKYVDPNGLETYLVYGLRTDNNVVGHIAIVTGGKLYSFGTNYSANTRNTKDWGVEPAVYLNPQDKTRQTVILKLKISPDEEAKLQKTLDENNPNAAGKPSYDPLSNSCVTVTEVALQNAGVLPDQPGAEHVDGAGNQVQAGAPKSIMPADVVNRVEQNDRVDDQVTVGNQTTASFWESLWNSLRSIVDRAPN